MHAMFLETGKVGGGVRELTESQNRTLQAQQYSEFRKRYTGLSGVSSQMILCKDAQKNNAIIGCAGVEIDTVAIFVDEPTPSNNLLNMLPSFLSVHYSIPAKPTGRWETKMKYAPLMSNLVVSRQYRRKGIAEKLVAGVEDLCQEWGYDECFLFVEKRNVPAVKLYQKLGYKTLWQDDKAKTLIPTKKGGLESGDTVILCMKKPLTGRKGGRKLLSFLPF
jgi:GNAT superfamily N-acetyltransferase